jgi:hypothetical protein
MSLLNAYFDLFKQDILLGDKTIRSYLLFINPIKLNWNLIVVENIYLENKGQVPDPPDP